MSFHELKTQSLRGEPVELSRYKGKVLLVVNTASKCGFTNQYEGLEKLHTEYKTKGAEVIGFPSNDFGGQEPGTAEQIETFCRTTYSIQFPLMHKVKTKGAEQDPVYAFLAKKHGEPAWNFHKYVVGKDGTVRAAFKSGVKPESAEVRKAMDDALKE